RDQRVGDRPEPAERAAEVGAIGEDAVDLGPGLVGGRGGRLAAEPPTQEGFRHADRLSSPPARRPPPRAGVAPTRAIRLRTATLPAPRARPPGSARSADRTPRRPPSAPLPRRPVPGRRRRPRRAPAVSARARRRRPAGCAPAFAAWTPRTRAGTGRSHGGGVVRR